MIKTYFKIAWRNLWKNKSFTLINLVGLSLGMASIMTLTILVNQYFRTDDFHANKDRLYYLKTFNPDGSSYRQTVFPLLYEIQRSCPEVEASTHWQQWNAPWLEVGTKSALGSPSTYVDPDFLTMFSFELQEGNPLLALKNKYSVVISSSIKKQLFGNQEALGQSITIFDSIPVTVTGVLKDIPANSTIKPDVLFPVELLKADHDFSEGANWYNTFAENYLLLKKDANRAALDMKIAGIVKKFYSAEQKHSVVKAEPFTDLKKESGPIVKAIITGSTASAIFILVIIVVNLLNLNAAVLFSRTREVAIRRMIGSGKTSIVIQFCLENALLIFSSLLIGFYIFKKLLLPQVNNIIGSQLREIDFTWIQDYPLVLLFLLVAILITIIAGSIPSLNLTALKVTEAVKGRLTSATNNNRVRNIFITVQFTLAVTFICITIILNSQIRFMKSSSLGFNKEDLAVVNLDLAFKNEKSAAARFEVLLNSLKSDPAVKSFSTSMVIPTAYWENYNNFIDLENNKEVNIRQEPMGAGFTNTYQVSVLEGRNFNDELAATEKDKILINESTVKAFGWTHAIGKRIRGKGNNDVLTVIGVMKDFHYSTLESPIEPLLHVYSGTPGLANMNYLSLRLNPKQAEKTLAGIEEAFKDMPSRRSFSFHYMDDLVEGRYALLDGILKVTNYVGALTIFISCMGMLGLIALFARRRVKEIGIRKVLGASAFSITTLLTKDFLRLVALAIIIATPLAWLIMSKWLEGFAYRVHIGLWMFLVSGAIAFLLAIITVSYQTIKAANANPMKSLRTE